MKLSHQIISVLTVVEFCCIFAGATPRLNAQTYKASIGTDSAAVVVANTITGLDKLYDSPKAARSAISAVHAKYVDTTTPFLHAELDGRSAWRVTYEQLTLRLDNLKTQGRTSLVNCEVWLDSTSGQLLRVEMRKAEGDATVGYRLPTPQEAERQIKWNNDRYVGLPEEPPVTDLVSALSKCKYIPLVAKHTIVQYLLVTCDDPEPFPAWVIYMRGCSPIPFSQPAPARAACNRRTIVNAITGKTCGGIGNTPFPETD